eukprot:scaffold2200_cov413-Prasinococcus_capsulatus_cf.AAC.40
MRAGRHGRRRRRGRCCWRGCPGGSGRRQGRAFHSLVVRTLAGRGAWHGVHPGRVSSTSDRARAQRSGRVSRVGPSSTPRPRGTLAVPSWPGGGLRARLAGCDQALATGPSV